MAKTKKRPLGASAATSKKTAQVFFKKGKDILTRKNPDGSISLLNLQADKHFYSIEGIAAEFWLLMDGNRTLEAIKAALVKKHRPPQADFERDIEKFIKDLKREKLIQIVS